MYAFVYVLFTVQIFYLHTMKIQFLRNHMQYKDGDIAELSDNTAIYLVRCSAAEFYDENVLQKEEQLLNIIERNEGLYDLQNVTFIIPVFFDHVHRKQNLLLTLAFIRKNFNTNIIIGEYGGCNFEFLSEYVGYEYIGDLEYFHRTKIINRLVMLAKTPIVVNWDADNICNPIQIIESVEAIRNGCDISYPFNGDVVRVPRHAFGDAVKRLDVNDIQLIDCQRKGFNSVGHAVVMCKQSFIDCGMENENFITWGPEDGERWNRYNILELKTHRASGSMYHMDHHIGPDSSSNHKWFLQNNAEYEKVIKMKKGELQRYIATWSWCNIANLATATKEG